MKKYVVLFIGIFFATKTQAVSVSWIENQEAKEKYDRVTEKVTQDNFLGFLRPDLRGKLTTEMARQAGIGLANGDFSMWQPGLGPRIQEHFLQFLTALKRKLGNDETLPRIDLNELRFLFEESTEGTIGADEFKSNYFIAALTPGTGELHWYQRIPKPGERFFFVPGTKVAWFSIFCGNLVAIINLPREPQEERPQPEPPLPRQKGNNHSVPANRQPVEIYNYNYNYNKNENEGSQAPSTPQVVYLPPQQQTPSEIIVRQKANGWDKANTIFNGVSAVANVYDAFFKPQPSFKIKQQYWGQQPQYNNPFTPVYPGGPVSPPNGPYPGGPVSPPNGYPASPGNGGFTPAGDPNGGFTPVNNPPPNNGGFTPAQGNGSGGFDWSSGSFRRSNSSQATTVRGGFSQWR